MLHITLIAALITFRIVSSSVVTTNNCSCSHYPEVDWVGPYCSSWDDSKPSFCLLSGGPDARLCPGALQWRNKSLYWSAYESICEKSRSYTVENCNCAFYDDYSNVGPYCGNWSSYIPYCLLSGRSNARFCPGSTYYEDGLYWTNDQTICDRCPRPDPKKWSFKFGQPFKVEEIVQICLYIINMLLGTSGNAFVIKNFASEDKLMRPGSRFVIVLAAIDFVSCVWIPSYFIIKMLYAETWPFGATTCRIMTFYPSLYYATPWLLLAISVERARAIYRPFANRLSTRFVISISVLVLVCSVALTMYEGLSFRYADNFHHYLEGAVYEYSLCYFELSFKEILINMILTRTVGVWFPMLLIALVYTFMFLKLKNQLKGMKRKSSHDGKAQMKRILRTFTVVIAVFYICYLPQTILYTIYVCYRHLNKHLNMDAFETANTYLVVLYFSNGCLNPVIYSRIDVKLKKSIRRIIKIRGKTSQSAWKT